MKKLLSFTFILFVSGVLFSVSAQIPTTGLRLHLKADAGTSSTISGQKISFWNDQSGNGIQAIESNSSWQPTYIIENGISMVRFNPSAPTSMNLPSHSALGIQNSDSEIFIVSRSNSSNIQFVLAGGINFNEIQYNGASGVRYIPRSGMFVDNSADADNGGFHIINAIATSTNAQLGIDGTYATQSGNALNNQNIAFNLGTRGDGSFRLDGDIAEVIIYNRKLSTSESMQVSEYLKNKYSTPFTAYGAPQTPAGSINFTGVTQNSMTVNLAKGSGTHRVIIARKGGAVNVGPTNGVAYTGNSAFGAGSDLGGGNYVVYAGTEGTSTAISGLDFSANYHFAVYEYYLLGGVPQYGSAATASETTTALLQANSLQITGRTADTVTGGVSAGSGTHRLIVARAGSAVNQGPIDGTSYIGNSTFGAGTQIGTGNYVIYSGTDGSSFSLTGLNGATVYHLAAFEYVINNGVPQYQVVNPPVNSGITYPSTSASSLQFSSIGVDHMTVSFTAGDGQKRVVIAREAQAVSAVPVDGQSYSANSVFGSGQDLGSGNFVVYDGSGSSFTVTGLTNTTTYHFAVYEYSEYNGTVNFKTSGPALGSQGTSIVPLPTASIGDFSNYASTSVTIAGTVNPNGYETFVSAVYGTDPNNLSGSTTPVSVGSGAVQIPVSVDVSDLTVGELYYVAIKATNIRGDIISSSKKMIPLNRTAMRGWYRADYIESDPNNAILNLLDASGLGNDNTEGRANSARIKLNQINGKPVMDFSDSGNGVHYNFSTDSLDIKNKDLEMFIVYKTPTNQEMNLISFYGQPNLNPRLILNPDIFNTGVDSYLGGNVLRTGARFDYTNNAAHLIHYKTANTATYLRVNDLEAVSGNFNGSITSSFITIGSQSGGRFLGDIAEVIFYNQAITPQQRVELANYLSNRYGIAVFTPTAPTVAAGNLQFPTVQPFGASVTLEAGNGTERLFVARLSSSPKTAPVNGVTYTANASFGSGSDLGNGNFVVGKGTGTAVTITGLASNTDYTIDVYEYNFMELEPYYLPSSPNSASFTTQNAIAPLLSATLSTFSANSAIISSVVNPNSLETTLQVSYGTSSSNLNLSTAIQNVGNQSETQPIQTQLTGLTSGKRYYYRVTATSSGGSVQSEIGSFFTDFTVNNSTVSLPSLQYWLAGDGAIDTTESGNRARLWANQAGKNGRLHASQVGLNDRPTIVSEAGVTFLRFDGLSDFMELTFADSLELVNSDYEIFIVARSSSSNIGFLMGGTIPNFELHTRPGGEIGTRFIPKTGVILDNPVNSTDGNFHIINALATDVQTTLRVDGNTNFTNVNGRSGVASQLILGSRRDGSFYFNGDIAEILIYNAALSEVQSWEVNSYLATKYGVNLTDYKAPTVQTSSVQFINNTTTSVTVSATKGDGLKRLMVMRESTSPAVSPQNNISYTANPAFGSGSTTGVGNFVILSSTDSVVTVTGLVGDKTYVVDAYEYNEAGQSIIYATDTQASRSYFRHDNSVYEGNKTYFVSSLGDGNIGSGRSGTLRYVLNEINSSASDSTSLIDLRYVSGTITLTAELPPLNYNTIVLGAGRDSLSISGANLYRPFFIGAGTAPFTAEVPASPTITFKNFTITQGRGKGGDSPGGGGAAGMGGAIFVNDGLLTLEDMSFTSNSAVGGSNTGANIGSGGGGFGGDGAVNTAGASGFLGGTVPSTPGGHGGPGAGGFGNAIIAGNGGFGAGGAISNILYTPGSMKGGDGGFGGGGGAPATVSAALVSAIQGVAGFGGGNSLPTDSYISESGGGAGMGGALFNRYGTVIIKNVAFNSNATTGGLGGAPNNFNNGSTYGGALFNYQGIVLQENVSFSGNSATNSNDYFNYSSSSSSLLSQITLSNSTNTGIMVNATLNTLRNTGSYYVRYSLNASQFNDSTSVLNYSGNNETEQIAVNVPWLNVGQIQYYQVVMVNEFGRFTSEITSRAFNNSIPGKNLTLWLSADRGVQTGAGAVVTSWSDYSGLANNTDQTVVGYQPTVVENAINSNPVLRFNGSAYFTIPQSADLGLTNSDYEVFIVGASSSSDIQFLISGGINEQEIHLNGASGVRFLPTAGKVIDAGSSGQFTNGAPFLLNMKATNTEGSTRVNNALSGVLSQSVRSSVDNQMVIGTRTGGSLWYNGDIAEMIFYSTELSPSAHDSVQNYLATKYGITLSAPVTEPTQASSRPVLEQKLTTSVQFSVTKGNGNRRIVLAKESAEVDALPNDFNNYTANATFGAGSELGTGNFVVYAGTDSVFNVSGLSSGTTYHFSVFEYNTNSIGFEPNFLTSSGLNFLASTINAMPGVTASGSLKFNGDDEVVSIPHNSVFNSDAITIEMWFKPQNVGSVPFLIAKGAEEMEIHLVNSNRSIRFIPTTFVYIDSPENSFEFDRWNHVAVSYKPGESLAQMWVNGMEVPVTNNGGNPLTQPFKHTTSSVYLGQRVNTLPYTGELDEVRIWNDVRTTQEIREHMFTSIQSDFNNLISYFQFNEGSGTSASDAISGFDGTLSGFEFDANNGWRDSGIPFGTGSFVATDAVTSGTINASGLAITLTENFDAPVSVISNQFTVAPLLEASGNSIHLNNPYWVVGTSANAGAYEATLTFTVPSEFLSTGTQSNNKIKLYARPFGSDGAWSLVKTSASSFTSTSVSFEGVTQLGQFALGRDVSYEFDETAGNSLLFDGTNDYIEIPYNSSMNMQKITIEFWIKWNGGEDYVMNRGLFQWDVRMVGFGNRIEFSPASGVLIETASNAFTQGQWTHVALVYDPTQSLGKIYVNGMDETASSSGSLNQPLLNGALNLFIGRYTFSGNFKHLAAEMDELRIWNTARTQQQIQENMNRTLPAGNYSDLAMYFQFNEDSGSTVSEIQNGVSGTLINFDFNENSGWQNSLIPITQQISTNITLTGTQGWRLLASPVSADSYSPLLSSIWTQGFEGASTTSGSANVFTWQNTSAGNSTAFWQPFTTMNTPMQAGSGVLVYVFEDDNGPEAGNTGFPKTISISGTETIQDKNLTSLLNPNVGGWTLLGNPFSKDILWNGISRSGITGSVYVWDANSSAWRTWNGLIGSLTNGQIGAFNGFFVETNAANPTFTIPQNARIGANDGFLGKKTETEPIALALQLKSAKGLSNEAWFMFSEEGKAGKDEGDTYKLAPLSEDWVQLASTTPLMLESELLLDINNVPLELDEWIFPLDVQSARTGEYEIDISAYQLPESWRIRLVDVEENKTYSLQEPVRIWLDHQFAAKKHIQEESESVKLKSEAQAEVSATKAPPAHEIDNPELVQVTAIQTHKKSGFGLAESTTNKNHRYVLQVTRGEFSELIDSEKPKVFELSQNYPNPFNPATNIQYAVPEPSLVRLQVFDVLGREVATLVSGQVEAGYHQVPFDASNLASGMYIYRLQAGNQVFTKKLTLIK